MEQMEHTAVDIAVVCMLLLLFVRVFYNRCLWEGFLEVLVGGRLHAFAHGMHSVGLVVVRVVGPANGG